MSRRIFNPDPEPTASVDRRSLWSLKGKKVFLKSYIEKKFDKHLFSLKIRQTVILPKDARKTFTLYHFCTVTWFALFVHCLHTRTLNIGQKYIHRYMFKPWPIDNFFSGKLFRRFCLIFCRIPYFSNLVHDWQLFVRPPQGGIGRGEKRMGGDGSF